MKKVYISGIITILCIVATVLLRILSDNTDVDYTEVQAEVVSVSTKETSIRVNYSRNTTTTYEVIVSYMGENYELQNVHAAYLYSEGTTTTAYLSNGKLYANVEGIQSSTPAATAYFVALFSSFGMLFVTLWLWQRERERNK